MDNGDRRSGAAARPWHGVVAAGNGGGGPPPPKVYLVEPRDFRELVQRLTGAAAPAAGQRVTPGMVTQAASGMPVPGAGPTEQFDYASWLSAHLLSPAPYGAPGFGGGYQQQQQGSSGPLL